MTTSRHILFLYPNNKKASIEEQNVIFDVIEVLKITSNMANETLTKIMQDASYAFISNMPSVHLSEEHHYSSKNININDNTRICVINFNGTSFLQCYSSQRNENISHLIGLKITSDDSEPKYYADDNSLFDVIIEIGLIQLEKFLVSVALDICLYHYFHLNQSMEMRKTFSAHKAQYIMSSVNNRDYEIDNKNTKITYLPFSFPYTQNLHNKNTNIIDCFKQMISEYFKIVISYNINKIEYNLDREPQDSADYPSVPPIHIMCLNNIVNDKVFYQGRNYFIAIDNYLPEKNNYNITNGIVIIEDNDKTENNWLMNFTSTISDYTLYYIILK